MVDETRSSQMAVSSSLSSSPREKTSPISIAAYIIAIAGSMAFIIYYAKNLEQYLDDLKHLGFWGNLIFIVSYLPAGLPFALVSYYIPLSLSAGFLYGEGLGLTTAMLGSVSSSMFGFWVTRTFCRSWIEEKIKSSVRLSAFLLAMEYHSFKVTLMVRFLPIPFGLQNALCAMTSITASKFLLSSSIGLLPENMLLIYFGSTFENISETTQHGDLGSISTYEKVILGAAVLATCVIFVVGRRMFDATLAMARAGNKKMEDVDMQLLEEQGEGINGNGQDGDHRDLMEVSVESSNSSSGSSSGGGGGGGGGMKKSQSFGKENNSNNNNKEQLLHSSSITTPVKMNKNSNMLPDPPPSKHKGKET